MDSNDRFMDQITKGRKAERRTAEYGKGDERYCEDRRAGSFQMIFNYGYT